MKRTQVTSGAALILVVLFTMLLLAGILAATMRLGLGSRQNTADQAATLRAQYAAESGVTLAQSRLRDIQLMLSQADGGQAANPGLFLARNIRFSAVRGWVNQLCGSGSWQGIREGEGGGAGFFDQGAEGGGKNYPSAQACVPAGLNSDDNFTLLARIVTPASYTLLPASERPAATEAARKTFWRSVLTQPDSRTTTGLNTTAETQLTLTRVLRLTPDYHRVFLKVSELTATAETGLGARRVISAQGSQDGEWWFDVVQPSLLDAVVQTDYHTTMPLSATESGEPVTFTTGTRFQGPLKTNDVFTFTTQAGYNSPRFSGKITSAGCLNRIVTNDEVSCTRDPGVRINSTVARDFNGTQTQQSTAIQQRIATSGVNVDYNSVTPDFAGEYQPFPTIVENQENAASGLDDNSQPLPDNSRGLVLASGVRGVQLFVGDAIMNPPQTYNANQRRWNESSPSYQYIRPITGQSCAESLGGSCTYTYSDTVYRVDSSKRMYSKTGNGTWTLMSNPFNGVIYQGSGSSALTVVGPGRVSGATPEAQAQPALASFMGITVATERTIDIRSDLAMSQTPCRYDEYDGPLPNVSPPCKERENVLGLFSSRGKVVVKKQVPDNAVIQAALMASEQEFTVEGYDSGAPRGDIIFTGSLVEKYYGANGVFGTRCVQRDRWGRCTRTEQYSAGYNRDYSHDKRFLDGLMPPFYPTSPKWSFVDASRDGRDLTRMLRKQGS